MARRRMFSNDVIDTDKFIGMPLRVQCLYFHLGLRADDDGFVSNPKMILRLKNCRNEDLEILRLNGYIHIFENGVIVITHWKINNTIRADRYKETMYLPEKIN